MQACERSSLLEKKTQLHVNARIAASLVREKMRRKRWDKARSNFKLEIVREKGEKLLHAFQGKVNSGFVSFRGGGAVGSGQGGRGASDPLEKCRGQKHILAAQNL